MKNIAIAVIVLVGLTGGVSAKDALEQLKKDAPAVAQEAPKVPPERISAARSQAAGAPFGSESERAVWNRLYEWAVASNGVLVLEAGSGVSPRIFKVDAEGNVSLIKPNIWTSSDGSSTMSVETYKTDRSGEKPIGYERVSMSTEKHENLTGGYWTKELNRFENASSVKPEYLIDARKEFLSNAQNFKPQP